MEAIARSARARGGARRGVCITDGHRPAADALRQACHRQTRASHGLPGARIRGHWSLARRSGGDGSHGPKTLEFGSTDLAEPAAAGSDPEALVFGEPDLHAPVFGEPDLHAPVLGAADLHAPVLGRRISTHRFLRPRISTHQSYGRGSAGTDSRISRHLPLLHHSCRQCQEGGKQRRPSDQPPLRG